MKITDLKVWVTVPERSSVDGSPSGRSYVFLRIDTDEGISGFGEATSSGGGGSIVVGNMIEFLRNSTAERDFRETIIGENPEHVELIWHKLFRRFTGGGGFGGFVTTMLSGIDIALWDIKGKAAGKPIYEILGGGPLREEIELYTHVDPGDPIKAADQAKMLAKQGFRALKTDPFMPEMRQHHRRYMQGSISPEGAALATDTISAIREGVGESVDILIDCHGNFDVPTAIAMARKLEPFNIGWYEEPVQPNSNQALKHVKESVSVPICVGERLYTRWDFIPVLKDRLAEFLMPDILWTGGISEFHKIANLAESFYIPVSPHDASGPINIMAGAHTMMTVPNFYKLEFNHAQLDSHNSLIDRPLDIVDGKLKMSEDPGLGIELDVEFIEAHLDEDWN
ncbi:MAG TPA: mandelate racemase/muconate lactonizing enzyme family protein [Dehalococcoidia bacterium]|nr:mandelate racemase/muconate lactonizing enzyme family protein [Dehalococcoidia bacterium]